MFGTRRILFAICFLVLGAFLIAARSGDAGDKKKEEKTKEEKKKKPQPILDKGGELTASDEKDKKLSKSPCKIHPITLKADAKYLLELKSKDFDPYLRLLDVQGNEVAFNDDAGPSTFDSRIVYQPAKTGDFKIVVTSYDGRTGKYSLVAIETDGKTPLLTGSRFVGKPAELKFKDGKIVYQGELTEKASLAFGRRYQVFTVPLDEGKTYRIESRASDPKVLDAYLFLEDAGGASLASNGIGGKDANPRIDFKAPKSAAFRIIVTSAREAQVGRYTLEIAAKD